MSTDVEPTVTTGPASTPRRLREPRTTTALQRYALVLAWAALTAVFAAMHPGVYLTVDHVSAMLSTQSVLLILSLAAIAPLLAGDLDLSVAANLALAQVMFANLNVNHGWSVPAAAGIALALSLLVGLFNSAVIVGLGIDSIVVTLGMSTLLAGVALSMGATPILGVSDSLVDVLRFRVYYLQVAFWIALLLCLVLWFVFTQTRFGRHLLFVGANRNAAKLAGVRVDLVRTCAFVISALLSGVAGVMLAGLFASADANTAPTLLLPALAAVFLGATAFTPGRFNVPGTFVAVYFLVFGISGLEISGLSGWVSQAFYGGSLVVAVILSNLGGRLLRVRRPSA
jgi:ribose transport system permease protein